MALFRTGFASLYVAAIIAATSLQSAETPTLAEPGLMVATGRVLGPDGTPAVGAVVNVVSDLGILDSVVTDENGKFQLKGVFGNSCQLHALSGDTLLQATRMVSPGAVRTALLQPIELKLGPTTAHELIVLSTNSPAEKTHVVVTGIGFLCQGVSDSNGRVTLRLPDRKVQEVVAWHPLKGIDGWSAFPARNLEDSSALSLRSTEMHTIRVVDPAGKAVANVELAISAGLEDSHWIAAKLCREATVRTDADGVARVPWLPRERLEYVEAELLSPGWKIDDVDRESTPRGATTIRVRRTYPVLGRLVVPEGVNPLGILVKGSGFGPGGRGDIPTARVGRDGSFQMQIPSDHAYVLGVMDQEWASDPWTGLVLPTDESKPAPVSITAYQATPVTIRISRGKNAESVADAWVNWSMRETFSWTDAMGTRRTANAAVGGWYRPDSSGEVRFAVGRGQHSIRLSANGWSEDKGFGVDSTSPVAIEFHRPWVGDRHVAGKLTRDGQPYQPSKSAVALAWSNAELLKLTPEVDNAGQFELKFDAPKVAVVVVDANRMLSGHRNLGPEDIELEIPMQAAATYTGTVLDEHSQPVAGIVLSLVPDGLPRGYRVVAEVKTDSSGRFRFPAVPVGMPLRLVLDSPEPAIQDRLELIRLLFESGERRSDVRVKYYNRNAELSPEPPIRPLAERVANVTRDSRLNGTQIVVIVSGDDSEETKQLKSQLLDFDENDGILKYSPLQVGLAQVQADQPYAAEHQWPIPATGEVVLLVLGDNQQVLTSERLNAGVPKTAIARAAEFLQQHAPPARDARQLLQDALQQARETGRRVWLVEGGTRCYPCLLLARWMNSQHQLLEQDYVLFKVKWGIDGHCEDVMQPLDKSGAGIPWHAILDPDGKVLTTSDGPLGNIGMPGSIEGRRHMRRMLDQTRQRLTEAEVETLIKSLATSD